MMKHSPLDTELLITRVFDARPSLLFDLWSKPEHFRRWMGPETFTCDAVEIDFRVGGAYRAMIASPEMGENWFGGIYREIERHTRIVFTFAWHSGPSARVETIITLTFEDQGNGKTLQTFHQTGFRDAERRDSHAFGWNSAFDKLDAYVATHAGEST
jgi:uncharacterized protein YndB with AHSA1/START domain